MEEHIYEDKSVYSYSALTMNHIELNGLFIADTGFSLEKREESFSKSKDVEIYKKDADYFMKDRHFKSFVNLLDFNLTLFIPLVEKARNDCQSIISLIDENMKYD